ncbi:MAG: hypothetical protein WCA89_16360 [Terracidiphilus sp.]|jgi:hypothetical protein
MLEQAQLDFDARMPIAAPQAAQMPTAAHEDAPGRAADGFGIGEHVFLRGAPFGHPGRVVRVERGRLAVLWPDLGPSYIGRHRPDSLTLADVPAKGEL